MEHSKNYESVRNLYLNGYCTDEQLYRYTLVQNKNKSITIEEYEQLIQEKKEHSL